LLDFPLFPPRFRLAPSVSQSLFCFFLFDRFSPGFALAFDFILFLPQFLYLSSLFFPPFFLKFFNFFNTKRVVRSDYEVRGVSPKVRGRVRGRVRKSESRLASECV